MRTWSGHFFHRSELSEATMQTFSSCLSPKGVWEVTRWLKLSSASKLLGNGPLLSKVTSFLLIVVKCHHLSFTTMLQVSWLKRHGDTPHLLTFGLTTYSSDSRFQIFHEQPNDWKLQIQFPQLSDEGIYECLVSSNPPLVRRTRLSVIGE